MRPIAIPVLATAFGAIAAILVISLTGGNEIFAGSVTGIATAAIAALLASPSYISKG